ncbi:MAG TPA: hypothetical protein VMJ35_06470 [Dongiaceae bacterium]|nr:hypothetical protein [Dongiaceae bacterium]
MPLAAIAALCGLSLGAAFVLFKFLQSTASVSKPEYQLGGAAAGFVVILGVLSVTYMKVNDKQSADALKSANQQIQDLQAKLQKAEDRLKTLDADVTYSGTVSPALHDANVVFAVKEAKVQEDGRFVLNVRAVHPKDLPSIYVIGPQSRAPYKQVFPEDNSSALTISSATH